LSCQRAQELIHGYVDDELDGLQTAEVERHINQCENCKLDYRSHMTLRSSFQHTSLYYRAPTDLKKSIRASLVKEARVEVTPRAFLWRWVLAGVTLAILAIGAIWNVVPLFVHPASEDLLVQEIVADHIRSLQVPNHQSEVISSDRQTVKSWFNSKIISHHPLKILWIKISAFTAVDWIT
jgi:hypothetical protein